MGPRRGFVPSYWSLAWPHSQSVSGQTNLHHALCGTWHVSSSPVPYPVPHPDIRKRSPLAKIDDSIRVAAMPLVTAAAVAARAAVALLVGEPSEPDEAFNPRTAI
jgi:hypothetical protein